MRRGFRSIVFGFGALLACSRTSLQTFQTETDPERNSGRSGDSATAGHATQAGGGNQNATTGGVGSSGSHRGGNGFGGAAGTFGSAGAVGIAGTFIEAGTSAVGVGGSVPMPGVGGSDTSPVPCSLAVSDCRSKSEPQCTNNPACEGADVAHQQFGNDTADVTAMASAPNDRIAIAGTFQGKLDFGGTSQVLTSASDSTRAMFIAVFDAQGQAEWAFDYHLDGEQVPTGIDFSPDGDVLVQGRALPQGPGSSYHAFIARLGFDGHLEQELAWGNATVEPGSVDYDNNGNAWLAGTFTDVLDFGDGTPFESPGKQGYLFAVDPAGLVVHEFAVRSNTWLSASIHDLAVDDEDNLLVVGQAERADHSRVAFLRKYTQLGDLLFEKEYWGQYDVWLGSVSVDRNMNVFVGGDTRGNVEDADGIVFSPGDDATHTWLVRYNRQGDLQWQTAPASKSRNSGLLATSADVNGNLVVLGRAADLEVDDLADPPFHPHGSQPDGATPFVLKLRPTGAPLWLRWLDNEELWAPALATNNQSHIWVGGSFRGQATFGNDVVEAQGSSNAFLLELSP